MKKTKIICIGEILWDSMPQGLYLGGAPYNVAYHLNKLGANVNFVSCVGDDDLGHEAIKRTAVNGMSTDLIQIDDRQKTGFVDVDLGSKGIPLYNIKKPAAWDFIRETEALQKAIHAADVIVFGTLAQRMKRSWNTIKSIKKSSALKVLDLNLRTPFDDMQVVLHSLEMADFLKVNIGELLDLKKWFGLPEKNKDAVRRLLVEFDLQCMAITFGSNGAIFFDGSNWIGSEGIPISVVDTVGAGDAFLASLIIGYVQELPPKENLMIANKLGAYVATCTGATPNYDIKNLTDIDSLLNNESSVA